MPSEQDIYYQRNLVVTKSANEKQMLGSFELPHLQPLHCPCTPLLPNFCVLYQDLF